MQSKIERSKTLLGVVLKRYGIENPQLIEALSETVNQICRERVASGSDTWAHPAIRAIRAIVNGQSIPSGLYPVLIETIGGNPDAQKLSACYREWHARGKPRSGWAWALEWYVQGIPQRNTGAQPQPTTLQDMGLA